MSKLTPQAEQVLEAFGKRSDTTPEHLKNLTAAIKASPAVIEGMNRLVAEGHLKAIAPMAEQSFHAGGVYDDRHGVDTIRLPLAALELQKGHRTFDEADLTFVMGHEPNHGLNYKERAQAYSNFERDVKQQLSQRPPRDYTEAVGAFIAERRGDEAQGQIAGWNAVVSALHEERGVGGKPLTLADAFEADPQRMKDFVEQTSSHPQTFEMKPGLTIKSDLSMGPTDTNVAAVGKYFFDKIPEETDLGRTGESDYANYYGAYAVGRTAQLQNFYDRNEPENLPRITLNMSKLHLSASLIEKNGIDMGGPQADVLFLDSSHGRSILTAIANTGPAPTSSPETVQGKDPPPIHYTADDPLYRELQQRLPPETSDDRLAQITLTARSAGLEAGNLKEVHLREDAVWLMGNQHAQVAKVDLTTAPPDGQQSLQQLDNLNQQQAQALSQAQAQGQQQTQQSTAAFAR